MTENHPITPTLKLFRKWTEYRGTETEDQFWWRIATQAARWGADYELEACCKMLYDRYDRVRHATGFPGSDMSDWLRAARRPKPPSLKEQALLALSHLLDGAAHSMDTTESADYIRLALEQLND